MISGTFFTQVMFADFEWRAHRMVEDGEPITADALRALYTELWKDYQGPAVTFDEPYRDTWARISHFYTAPYYVYQYSTCYASSGRFGHVTGSARRRSFPFLPRNTHGGACTPHTETNRQYRLSTT